MRLSKAYAVSSADNAMLAIASNYANCTAANPLKAIWATLAYVK